MKITTVDELKQYIGKFIVFSEYDENCNDTYATIKLLTKIENIQPWLEKIYPNLNKNGILGYKIWGKFSANFKIKFQPFSSNGKETYSTCYKYARTPTEQELKQFKNYWRLKRYYERKNY